MSDKVKDRERSLNRYKKLRALGLCGSCAKPTKKSLCPTCRIRANLNTRNYTRKLKNNNPSKFELIYGKDRYCRRRTIVASYSKSKNLEVKKKTLEHYGGKCVCCGETNIKFLTIDHTNNNGAEERRIAKRDGGVGFYRLLIKNNFPEGYQTLCFNCNIGKYLNNGVCPHKEVMT